MNPNKQWKKQRKIEQLISIKNKYYIFCEGEQTEPNYFDGFKKCIGSNSIYKNLVMINVEGVGAETIRVIENAIRYVTTNNITNAQIWCVYDKDSFPPEHFNKVSEIAENLNTNQNGIIYKVAWSNQCIEYWFLLHFNYYDSDNDRPYYKQNLNINFTKKGLPPYTKNDINIFEILTEHGDPKLAIRYAKKRIVNCCGTSDAASSPATRVYELVEELAKYLPEDIKKRYV